MSPVVLLLVGIVQLAADGPMSTPLSPPTNGPTDVRTSIELIEISQIEDRDEKFDIEFYLYFTWKDPRLAFDPAKVGAKWRRVSADSIWVPKPRYLDQLDSSEEGGADVKIQADGTCSFHTYTRATMSTGFDLHDFPFDSHELILKMEATTFEADEYRFVVDRKIAPSDHKQTPDGWRLVSLDGAAGVTKHPAVGEFYSSFTLRATVQRLYSQYFWSIIVPLIPIVAVSWAGFWLDLSAFSSQIGVNVTALLAVVASRIAIDASLPPIGYLTRMDVFLIDCQLFVFASVILAVAIHICYKSDTPEMVGLAIRINHFCRWALPSLMGLSCLSLVFFPPVALFWLYGAVALVLIAMARPTPKRLHYAARLLLWPEKFIRGN